MFDRRVPRHRGHKNECSKSAHPTPRLYFFSIPEIAIILPHADNVMQCFTALHFSSAKPQMPSLRAAHQTVYDGPAMITPALRVARNPVLSILMPLCLCGLVHA